MSSPLNIFRRYQRQVMVALLFVAMFTFVVGTPLAVWLSSGSAKNLGADKVAVTWKGGKLTESGLFNLRQDHNLLLNYLDALVKEARESGGKPKVTPISRARGDEDLVERKVKAQRAEQLGIVISEEIMRSYLVLLSDRSVSGQLKTIMNEATNDRLDEPTMFRQLRMELLAQKMETLAVGDLMQEFDRADVNEQPFAIPPAVAWDYFGRMHRRVRAEMYPIKVSEYIDQVKDQPSESQIQALYEEHKDDEPDPFRPEPGFKRAQQLAFQYVRADRKSFVAAAKKDVTEEQIKEHYEKNKEIAYVERELEGFPELDKPEDKKKPEDTKPEDKKPEAAKPEDRKPEDKKPEDAKPEDKKPEDKKPENAKPDDKKANETEKPAKPEGCQGETEKTATKQDDPAKTEPTKDDTKKEDAKKDEVKKDDTKKDETKKEDAKDPADEKNPPKEEPKKTGKKEVKYKPLDDKLKEDIRGQLAGPLATERITKAQKEVAEKIGDYGRELRTWEAVIKSDPQSKEPRPKAVDVKQLARSLGMSVGEVPLIDMYQMYEDGKRDKPKHALSRVQHLEVAPFSPGLPLFAAYRASLFSREADGDDAEFLYWRSEEKAAYVPTLQEAREDVIAAWKKAEAFKLAQAAAAKLAKSVGASGKSIAESLPAEDATKAFETESFSWLSRNTPRGSFGQYDITRIKKQGAGFPGTGLDDDAVDTPGTEFMEAVFALKKGECGVAENNPHTMLYVVRIIEEPLPEELLLQMFLDSPSKFEIYRLAAGDRIRQLGGWQREFKKEMAIKWQRDPWVNERM